MTVGQAADLSEVIEIDRMFVYLLLAWRVVLRHLQAFRGEG